ncbi:hypothetical protein TraAM80_08761, partial [Trypanosoma rangeli]
LKKEIHFVYLFSVVAGPSRREREPPGPSVSGDGNEQKHLAAGRRPTTRIIVKVARWPLTRPRRVAPPVRHLDGLEVMGRRVGGLVVAGWLGSHGHKRCCFQRAERLLV